MNCNGMHVRLAPVLLPPMCLACLVIPSSAVQLDFEDLTGMNYWAGNSIPVESRLADTYLLAHGVRFRSGSPFVAVVELGAEHATSGVNGVGGSTPDGVLTYSSAWPVVVEFYVPGAPSTIAVTDSVSWLGDLQGSPEQIVTLNAYDHTWSLIGSVSVADVGGALLEIVAPGIHAVEFLGPPDGTNGGVALDDLAFAALREPICPVESSSWGRIKSLFCQ